MLDIFAQTFGFGFLAMLLYVMVAECRAAGAAEQAAPKPARRRAWSVDYRKAIATGAIFPRF